MCFNMQIMHMNIHSLMNIYMLSLAFHNSRENEDENSDWLHFHQETIVTKTFSPSLNHTQFVNIQFCLIVLLVISQAVKSWEGTGIHHSQTLIKIIQGQAALNSVEVMVWLGILGKLPNSAVRGRWETLPVTHNQSKSYLHTKIWWVLKTKVLFRNVFTIFLLQFLKLLRVHKEK